MPASNGHGASVRFTFENGTGRIDVTIAVARAAHGVVRAERPRVAQGARLSRVSSTRPAAQQAVAARRPGAAPQQPPAACAASVPTFRRTS